MSIDILKVVQQNLGYPELQKMDPNTQHVREENAAAEDKFSQAAIPAVLTGFYKYVQSDAGAGDFLQNGDSSWSDKIFSDNENEAIQSISSYAGESNENVIVKVNEIAAEVEKVVKQNLSAHADIKEVKTFFGGQKNHILLYLPAALHMGGVLHDTTLDDNTNKMEGPISSLIKNIGGAFTNAASDAEIKKV